MHWKWRESFIVWRHNLLGHFVFSVISICSILQSQNKWITISVVGFYKQEKVQLFYGNPLVPEIMYRLNCSTLIVMNLNINASNCPVAN